MHAIVQSIMRSEEYIIVYLEKDVILSKSRVKESKMICALWSRDKETQTWHLGGEFDTH